MNIFKKERGITLISLVVSIIVLLILAGISIFLANNFIINKAELAAAKTVDETLKEQVEMAIINYEADNAIVDVNFNESVKNFLENFSGISNVIVTEGESSSKIIEFLYNNKSYLYTYSNSGNITQGNSIKNEIKIGDYVEYDVAYTDMYSGETYTSTNGWRVIDNGVMAGTSGYIKLISTGIPLTWDYDAQSSEYTTAAQAISDLLNNFENLNLIDILNRNQISKGSIFNDGNLAYKVSTITFEDMNKAYNNLYGTNINLKNVNTFSDSQKLFHFGADEIFYYWIANEKDATDEIYYISDEDGISSSDYYKIGIRPVIYLKNGLTGVLENNVWKFSN